MQNRPKIALIGALDFDMQVIKLRVEQNEKSPLVSAYKYQDKEKLSDQDLDAIINADLIYFFYDPSSSKTEARKFIPTLLEQIKDAKLAQGKKPLCGLVACVPKAISDEHKETTTKGALLAKSFGFDGIPAPVSVQALEDLLKTISRQIQSRTRKKSADFYGSVTTSASSAAQPTLSQPTSEPAVPGQPVPQVVSVQSLDQVLSSLKPEDSMFRDSLSHLNESLKRASAAVAEEAQNLAKIQAKAAEVIAAHQSGERAKLVVAIDEMATTTAKVLDGKPSIGKIVMGSILCFLGVALLAASIPLYLFLPPVGFAGTILATNIVAAGAAAAVGLPLAIGFGIFAIKNREMGVVLDSKQFINVARP